MLYLCSNGQQFIVVRSTIIVSFTFSFPIIYIYGNCYCQLPSANKQHVYHITRATATDTHTHTSILPASNSNHYSHYIQ